MCETGFREENQDELESLVCAGSVGSAPAGTGKPWKTGAQEQRRFGGFGVQQGKCVRVRWPQRS